MTSPIVISAAVEGPVDEAVLRKVCAATGGAVGNVYGNSGKAYILSRLNGYNHSAQHRHWVVLVDLDADHPCAPEAVRGWLPDPARLMSFRIAVRETEAWLLADREAIADFLRVDVNRVPCAPDTVLDPKREIVNLARRSRSRAIREDIVPADGSGQNVGPAYTSRMIEFIQDQVAGWNPARATSNSASLRSCLEALARLARTRFPPAS